VAPKIVDKSFDITKNYIKILPGAADAVENVYKDIKDVNSTLGSQYRTIFEIRDKTVNAAEDIPLVNETQAVMPLIKSPDDIAILYRSSFSDALSYDHRGRMIRAFPTFQMFIIDEGRMMQWHKLWDNFYGYNSLVSIDICKDRRIAADTAVISMTNMYNNLSMHDNEVSYGEWDYTLGDLIWGSPDAKDRVWKTIWDLPDEDILAARRDELNSMMLSPGARIHLRLGYGANAYRLPVVFNGTVTEMNTGDVVTVVAQGDGIELCNKLRVSPGDTNVEGIFGTTTEPRDYMGQMLTSKGNFLENLVNTVSGGVFYNTNPLGIVHFGTSKMPAATLLKDLDFFNLYEDYGEAAQNIYCSAGINTMSQWVYTEGSKTGDKIAKDWNWKMIFAGSEGGDEPSIKIDLFDKTPWAVFQIFAHACPDYIATVLPFEFRSTVFYGKPWWAVVDGYKYKYFYDKDHNMFVREPYQIVKKALSQVRMYSSEFDIINNGIKATEEFLYTNVIGMYDGGKKKTQVVQADSDIYQEKQKTAIVNLPIKADMWWVNNAWAEEKYAQAAATSALRDYMKDMYQGELVVLGDPTAKPYDKMYITDTHVDMTGLAEVKRVVHHFSMDTGFITSITPDLISVIDDNQGISLATWTNAAAVSAMGFMLGLKVANTMWRRLWTGPAMATFRKLGAKAVNALIVKAIGKAAGADEIQLKELEKVSDDIVAWFKKNLQNADVANDVSWKKSLNDLNGILHKSNTTYAKVADELFPKLSKHFTKFKDTIMEKGGVAKTIDKWWDSVECLREGKIFTKSSGLWSSLANKVFSATSKLKYKILEIQKSN
jgi:hypothetical protein